MFQSFRKFGSNSVAMAAVTTTPVATYDVKDFVIPSDAPVVALECGTAFDNLTLAEKLYAHHLSRASYYGALICLVQTSPESASLFSVLHRVFSRQTAAELRTAAVGASLLTDDEFSALLAFTCGVYANMGNYKSFGDSKIVPDVTAERLDAFLATTDAFRSDADLARLWQRIRADIYDLSPRRQQLGLGEKGITTYFGGADCCEKDADRVNAFMKSIQMEAYNNRVFKSIQQDGIVHYEIRLASVETGPMEGVTRDVEDFEGCRFTVTRGDYSPLLRLVVAELRLASEHAANDTERHMLRHYIDSFCTGSLAAHKDGSRHWVKNQGPIIEVYIGFIETYRDPAGMRGEFEGFVAVVNKVSSAKLGRLVAGAERLLPLLPWSAPLEKDAFLKPDFTSLDVLTYGGSGIPAGINIPNYDEIRQNEGFKNVSLGNVLSVRFKATDVPFLSPADTELINRLRGPAFDVQVALHELLGHGSGKLLRKNQDGSFNFDVEQVKAILRDDEMLSWYEEGETYDSKFTTMSSSYEECRAECVGLYLSLESEVLAILGHDAQDVQAQEDIIYANWLSMVWTGTAKTLEMYQPATRTWLQAHSQARFVILQVLLEAGQGLVEIVETKADDGRADLRVSLDRSKIATVGKEAIGNFLRRLQVYKSTGNVAAARAMYDKYSLVTDAEPYPFQRWRAIVMERKKPRHMFVQPNTRLVDGKVELVEYEATAEGLIQSWNERFADADVHPLLEELCVKEGVYSA